MTEVSLPGSIKTLPFFVALMVAVAIPLRVIGVAPEQTALGLALIAALALHLLSTETRLMTRQALTSQTAIFVGIVFLAWGVTLLFSASPIGSLKIGGRSGVFLFGVVMVWAALKAHENIHSLIWKVLIVGGVASTTVAALSLSGVPIILSILKADFSGQEIPALAFKAFAASALCMIPVITWAGRRLSPRWRYLAYAYTPLVIVLIMLSHNRSALAGLLSMIAVGMAALALTRNRHTKLLFVLASTASVAIMVWVRSDRMPLAKATANVDGIYLPGWLIDPHRQYIWKFAYEKFLDKPWFGNGIDQLNKLSGSDSIIPNLGSTAYLVPSHPHSWVLEILAEAGLIGFIPVLAALMFIAWKLLKRFFKTHDEGALAQLTLMAGFWASALFNFSIWAVWWQLTFFILFAIVSAAPELKSKSHD